MESNGKAIKEGDKMKGQCEVETCRNPAKWALYRTYSNGKKKWLHVCESHEQEIGRENQRRAGGYFSAQHLEALRK